MLVLTHAAVRWRCSTSRFYLMSSRWSRRRRDGTTLTGFGAIVYRCARSRRQTMRMTLRLPTIPMRMSSSAERRERRSVGQRVASFVRRIMMKRRRPSPSSPAAKWSRLLLGRERLGRSRFGGKRSTPVTDPRSGEFVLGAEAVSASGAHAAGCEAVPSQWKNAPSCARLTGGAQRAHEQEPSRRFVGAQLRVQKRCPLQAVRLLTRSRT